MPYRSLEDRVGHRFADRKFLETALTHPSWVNEARGAERLLRTDNERLEFLGDAVLGLLVSAELMRAFPAVSEGDLSRMRATIVNEPALAQLGRELDLGPWLFLGKGEEGAGGRHKPSILANAVEALMGAVFMDGGFDAAARMAAPWLERAIAGVQKASVTDAKSALQEHTQAHGGMVPVYEVVTESGPGHAKLFLVAVRVGGEEWGRAEGRSKKEAEQGAAAAALELVRLRAESAAPEGSR